MSSKPLQYLLVCLTLGSSVVACGKTEPEAPPTEAPEEPGEADVASKDEPDAGEAADVAAKDDDAGHAKGKRPLRDRINRRPAPRDADAENGVEGEEDGATKGARSKLGREAKGLGELKRPIDPPSDPSAPEVNPDEPALEDPSVPPMIEPAGSPVAAEPVPEPTPGQRPQPRDVPQHGAGLDATRLMPLTVVLDATKSKDLVDAGVLPGLATGQGYVSILYKGSAADKFGVSLQAWQDPGRREADDRFKRMRLQYPHAEDVKALEPVKAFYSQFNGIQMLTFVDSVKRTVATVACGDTFCTHEQLTKLAKTVRERL